MIRLLVSAIFSVILFSACTKRGGHLEYGLDVKDTFRINLQQEPPTLDWNKITDTTSSMIVENIMDPLVDFNLSDPEYALTPGLAEAWTPSNGAKTWTFTLRKGVKWTDGVDFKAQDVVDSWERLLNPATASEYAYFLFALKNAKAYNSGKVKDFKQVGVKIDDQGRLVVELEKPMSFFPMLLTHTATLPIRADLIKKFGNAWTDPQNIQTLGAYKLKVWDHDKAVVLERNDSYWGEKAKIKDILGYMINEYSTALSMFDSGKLDFQETIPFKEMPQYKDKPTFHMAPSLGAFYYGFNLKKAPFKDVRVRKAFAMAVDRKQVTDLLAAGQTPLTSWVPMGMFGYQADIGVKFDPEGAAKLLDEAGFKDRSKFPRITLAFNTNENHQRISENVQAQIKKNLGVEVQIESEEWKVYLARLHSDPPDIFRMSWLADYPDPDNFMAMMVSYSDNNYTGWKSQKYDDLVEQGASTLDKEKRRAIYIEAQKLLTEIDVPVLPMYSDVHPVLLSERTQNFTVNSLNRWIFKGVSLK